MKKIFLIFIMSLITIAAYCQEDGPPEDQIPIDGGVSLLFALGAAWGIKKLKDKR
jgi:hypothetical protein